MAIQDKKYDFEVFQGDDYRQVVRFKSGGEVRNLAGIAARMHVRESHDAEDPLIALSLGDGLEFTDGTGANGELVIVMTAEQTAAVPVPSARGTTRKAYFYDLEITGADGKVETELWGLFFFQKDATK